MIVGVLAAGCASAPTHRDAVALRVMSYNIQYGGGGLAGIAAAIRASSPDLVALQEVDVHWAERSGFSDQIAELGESLGMHVRFAPIYRLSPLEAGRPAREFGVAILSAYPIVRSRNDSLTRLSTQEANAVPAPMPGLLDVTIDVRGRSVRIFNTHLDYRPDPRVRAQQVAEMIRHIGVVREPTLVFGDFNAAPEAPELQPLFTLLRDSWPSTAGPGFTYPANAPAKRIDYVLVSPDFQVRSISVVATQASDHRPVVADLLLGRGSGPIRDQR